MSVRPARIGTPAEILNASKQQTKTNRPSKTCVYVQGTPHTPLPSTRSLPPACRQDLPARGGAKASSDSSRAVLVGHLDAVLGPLGVGAGALCPASLLVPGTVVVLHPSMGSGDAGKAQGVPGQATAGGPA